MQDNEQLHTATDSLQANQHSADTVLQVVMPQEESVPTEAIEVSVADSVQEVLPVVTDTVVVVIPKKTVVKAVIPKEQQVVQPKKDTVKVVPPPQSTKLYTLFPQAKNTYAVKSEPIWITGKVHYTKHNFAELIQHKFQRSQLNWTLLIALLCIVLLLIVRFNSKKLVSRVLNTMVNFQLADTMFRERNIITRRAFFMLNILFVVVVSLFTLLVTRLFQFPSMGNMIHDYLLICLIITGVLLVRIILYYIVGYIFEWLPAVNQQIHTSYLVNKNLGLVLLPLVFAAIYSSPGLSQVVLFIGIGIIFFATLYKIIRGFQIIIRNGVLLFYAILYLCTLELLPILIGAKLIILLR